MVNAMAAPACAAACPTGMGRPALVPTAAGALARQAAPMLAAALWPALPALLGPLPPTLARAAAVGTTIALFLLTDLAIACRERGRSAATLLLLLAAAALGIQLDGGPAVLALLYLLLRLSPRPGRAWSVAHGAALAALAAMCRVDAGSLASAQPCAWWLLLPAACLAAFSAAATTDGVRPAGARVRAPSGGRQIGETALVALLAAGVAGSLAVLGGADRVRLLGHAAAFLPAPFLLLGALRCGHLALSADAAAPRHLVHDRLIMASIAGAAAALAAAWFLALA